jgi:hypothetical protein
MRIEQRIWESDGGWQGEPPGALEDAALVLVFGSRGALEGGKPLSDLWRAYPRARFFGCSTAGEIAGARVADDTVVSTAVRFDCAHVETAEVPISAAEESRAAGERLAAALPPEGLAHVFVLSDGIRVNGTALVAGLRSRLPEGIAITGGLAGDGARFERTLLVTGAGTTDGAVAVAGFYGERLRFGCGSMGGWDPFGPERLITKARGNVLYELDGKSALALYKRYLGDHAAGLPATGLLFPLSLRTDDAQGIVRTILAVDENEQTMTFAGDMPEGAYARFMKANFDRLIEGAQGAARASAGTIAGTRPDLAILISCVGRKLILKQRVEEEIDAAREVLGESTVLAGFYSYGEISPAGTVARCELHNQTMTITTISER